MIKTHLDSGALIAAARGTNIASSRTILKLNDPRSCVKFCASTQAKNLNININLLENNQRLIF